MSISKQHDSKIDAYALEIPTYQPEADTRF
jgi:hypothetical protein